MHRDHTVILHGQRFHYTAWGDGGAATPALVLLHGITGHARTWDGEARALAARYRVFALDQRGHGDSDPAPDGDYTTATLVTDLGAFLDALAVGRVILVGLSLGGRVAIAYTGDHPLRVERLVVVDIGPEIAPAGRARVGALMAGASERLGSVEEAVAHVRAANPRYSEALLQARVRHGLKPLPDGGFAWKYDRALRDAVRSGRWRDTIDLWPRWRAIACSTLVVRGAESDVLSPDIASRMLAAQPRARLVEVPGAGHSVPGDQPAAFLTIVQEFLGAG
jgi:pimeloyl-ACP methyl ester carboxylesterase